MTHSNQLTAPEDVNPGQEWRERCYTCFRPQGLCFCASIPSIDNNTHLLIIQHVKERFHAFNTARIVKQALTRCELLVDQTENLRTRLQLRSDAAVLYPGSNVPLLESIAPQDRPSQLVIIDGTWHHARTLMRDIPALQSLPRFQLNPVEPSQYQLRREPTEQSLSTLEATVQAFRFLEPETRTRGLIAAFKHMIRDQLAHKGDAARIRQRPASPRARHNIPRVIVDHPDNVVALYGEVSFGHRGIRRRNQSLMYVVAKRLSDGGESFSTAVHSDAEVSEEFLQLTELPAACFSAALSKQDFCTQWNSFLRPDDVLCTFHAGPIRGLRQLGAAAGSKSPVLLKSVNLYRECRSLDEIMVRASLTSVATGLPGRPGRRLGNAIAYMQHLRRVAFGEAPDIGSASNGSEP